MLIIGGRRESHARYFGSVEPGAIFRCADCMPFEHNLTIWVARDPRTTLADVWPATKHFE